jgi:DNA-binding MarR family transcriptional regulator
MASDLLLFALRRATNTVSQDFQETLGRDDISPTAYAVLSLLREQPGLRQSQLSPAVGIRRTNLVPLLAELQQRGFFTRNPVPGDRRASALVLTEAGTEVATACAEACIRHEHRLQERLGPGGRLQLIELLGRLRAEESAG